MKGEQENWFRLAWKIEENRVKYNTPPLTGIEKYDLKEQQIACCVTLPMHLRIVLLRSEESQAKW